jgi:tRNA/rRNA methyltransferase/tRNA (cytidine32/uridine32-2'-O)-methyltransferase
MKNMGLDRLRIVAPEAPMDDSVILARSVHAEELWTQAEHYTTLAEAVADCSIVIGTTRRRGKKRKDFTLTPEETATYLRNHNGTAALVFGNERTGLEAAELKLCTLASHIPVSEVFPSLNLSHAAQIYFYELYTTLSTEGVVKADAKHWVPVDLAKISALTDLVLETLGSVGFYTQAGKEDQRLFFRDLLARSALTADEYRYLEGIIHKAHKLFKGTLDKDP